MTVERAKPMPQTVVELEVVVVVLVGYVCTQHTHCKNNSIRPPSTTLPRRRTSSLRDISLTLDLIYGLYYEKNFIPEKDSEVILPSLGTSWELTRNEEQVVVRGYCYTVHDLLIFVYYMYYCYHYAYFCTV